MNRESAKTELKTGFIRFGFIANLVIANRKDYDYSELTEIRTETLGSKEWFTTNEELAELHIVPDEVIKRCGTTEINIINFDVQTLKIYKFRLQGIVDQDLPGIGYIGETYKHTGIAVDLPVITFCPGECWTMIKEKYGRDLWNNSPWLGRIKIRR